MQSPCRSFSSSPSSSPSSFSSINIFCLYTLFDVTVDCLCTLNYVVRWMFAEPAKCERDKSHTLSARNLRNLIFFLPLVRLYKTQRSGKKRRMSNGNASNDSTDKNGERHGRMFVCLVIAFDLWASFSVLLDRRLSLSVVFTNRKIDHVYASAYFIQSYQITDDDYASVFFFLLEIEMSIHDRITLAKGSGTGS